MADNPRDRRYGSVRWRRLAKSVVVAPGYFQCWRPDCYAPATCADHIEPTSRDMPDALFFSRHNLRPSCKRHNLERGHLARLQADWHDPPSEPRPRSPLTVHSPFTRKPKVG